VELGVLAGKGRQLRWRLEGILPGGEEDRAEQDRKNAQAQGKTSNST
jgi:hypothetical protein